MDRHVDACADDDVVMTLIGSLHSNIDALLNLLGVLAQAAGPPCPVRLPEQSLAAPAAEVEAETAEQLSDLSQQPSHFSPCACAKVSSSSVAPASTGTSSSTTSSTRTLSLSLQEKWFKLMMAPVGSKGEKCVEYREVKGYWTTRLENRTFDQVEFTWGYGRHRPAFTAEWLGLSRGPVDVRFGSEHICSDDMYHIHLGRVLSTRGVENACTCKSPP